MNIGFMIIFYGLSVYLTFFLLSFFMLTTTALQYDYMLQKQELNEDICCSSVFTIMKHLPDCLAIESYLSLNEREKNSCVSIRKYLINYNISSLCCYHHYDIICKHYQSVLMFTKCCCQTVWLEKSCFRALTFYTAGTFSSLNQFKIKVYWDNQRSKGVLF